MPRVKRGVITKKKHKALRARAKGRRMLNRTTIKRARQADLKAGVQAYRDRRNKKRLARNLWAIQINAAARMHDLSYSKLIKALKDKKIELDRKILSSLANKEPTTLDKIIEFVK
ncbi:MAG TPA: 50S ribosomal protein L20 [Patescibacteria group bacterium]|nr:50S ribosomal protein L20 [Patescibacteria group bacterium]